MFSAEMGGIFVAGAIWFVGIISSFFSDEYRVFHSFWTQKILSETHIILITVSTLLGLFLLVDFVKNFRINISVEKKI